METKCEQFKKLRIQNNEQKWKTKFLIPKLIKLRENVDLIIQTRRKEQKEIAYYHL